MIGAPSITISDLRADAHQQRAWAGTASISSRFPGTSSVSRESRNTGEAHSVSHGPLESDGGSPEIHGVSPSARNELPTHEGDASNWKGVSEAVELGDASNLGRHEEIVPSRESAPHQVDDGRRADDDLVTSPMDQRDPAALVRPLREADLRAGARRMALAHAALRLIQDGISQRAAALRLSVSEVSLCRVLQILRSKPEATAEDFAPRRVYSGRKPAFRLSTAEASAVRSTKLLTNHTATTGSTPEALRIAARRGDLRPEIVEAMAAREAAGQTLLPETALRQLHVPESTVRAFRQPREAWLDYVTSPGSLQLTVDDESGEERMVQPGERWTIDDGSVNLVCCVPGLERPGDKCWDRWRTVVGRFQFLLVVDHRTRFVVGWSFTARPRDSYRAEDITATLGNCVREHGAPREIVLEHGVSAAKLISEALTYLGVRILRASSPHQKVVESVFNRLWTKLSIHAGQVGRFRGEEEEASRLVQRIRDGSLNPCGRLLDLPAVLAALRDAIAEHNGQAVGSERYGRWVPAEFWTTDAPKWLRQIAPADHWMFSPRITEPLMVRGFRVETSVSMLPGVSLKFVFGAEFLGELAGARVKLAFNPFAPECEATAILADDVGERRAGQVLGQLPQIDRYTRHTRRAMGYGADPDIGRTEAAAHAQALRRHVAATRPDGKPGIQTHEIRNGSGTVATAESNAPQQAERKPGMSAKSAFRPATEDEFAAQRARMARARAAQQRTET